MIKHVNEENFEEVISKLSKVILVDFYATWCGPCQMLSPVLEKIASSRADFDIVKIDIDESKNLTEKYNIQVVPTLIIFKDLKKVKQLEGYYNENELVSLVEEYID